MDAIDLAKLAERDLGPLLAVSTNIRKPKARRRKLGGREAPGNSMWVTVPGGFEVAMSRSLPLSIWEAGILEPYGKALADLDGIPDAVARSARDDVVLRAISSQLGGTHAGAVETAIRFLLTCASTTYEGQPVHVNLLLDLDEDAGSAVIDNLDSYREFDWYALLGSGLDSGVLIDCDGGVVQAENLRTMLSNDQDSTTDDTLMPDVFRYIGNWTEHGDRVSLSLARSREILIHQDGQIRYVYRSGRWRGLPLEVAEQQGWCTGASISRVLKKAVLASTIDASLAHHGACLAIVAKGHKTAFTKSGAISEKDLWPQSIRAQLFTETTFQELSRRHRLELLSMDGATVVDHQGNILTAGAIAEVSSGSEGGGRLAATKALAEFGAAFKVSQDGPISLFGLDGSGQVIQKMALA